MILLVAVWDRIPVPLQNRIDALTGLGRHLDDLAGRADQARPGRRGVTSW
jgi:hypothetical protein